MGRGAIAAAIRSRFVVTDRRADESLAELEQKLRAFIEFAGPAFLEVMIDQNADVFPMVGPGQSYAEMITGPFIPSRDQREAGGKHVWRRFEARAAKREGRASRLARVDQAGRISAMTTITTAASAGPWLCENAERACPALSPSTAANRSEAPSTTAGCP